MKTACLQRAGFEIVFPELNAQVTVMPTSEGLKCILTCNPFSMARLGPVVTRIGGALLSEDVGIGLRSSNFTYYELPGDDKIWETIISYHKLLAGEALWLSRICYTYGAGYDDAYTIEFHENGGSVTAVLPAFDAAEAMAWRSAAEEVRSVLRIQQTHGGYQLHLAPRSDSADVYLELAQRFVALIPTS
jgi:hypothetical protein